MDRHAVIGDVRGKGLFLGAELVSDRDSKEPAPEEKVQAVVADCMGQGVIIGATNRSVPGRNNTLLLLARADRHEGRYRPHPARRRRRPYPGLRVSHVVNAHGQPVGLPVALPLPRPLPPHVPLEGRLAHLVPMAPEHAAGFLACFTDPAGWTYLGDDQPFADIEDARRWAGARSTSRDPLFYTVLRDGVPLGFCSYLRITPAHGVIEIGYIHFSPALQGSAAATEVQYLMMRHAFDDLGYRRYEWKCDALNAPSMAAAKRLGFTYEGTFRQAMVSKGRNRDTAWFSILDHEWPAQKARFEAWLAPGNFDDAGRQRRPLARP